MKGYFIFPDDGSKSTDPKNIGRVQKPKVDEKDEKKSKLQKKVEGDSDEEEEQVLKPLRVKSSFNLFMTDQMTKIKEENKDEKQTNAMALA